MPNPSEAGSKEQGHREVQERWHKRMNHSRMRQQWAGHTQTWRFSHHCIIPHINKAWHIERTQ